MEPQLGKQSQISIVCSASKCLQTPLYLFRLRNFVRKSNEHVQDSKIQVDNIVLKSIVEANPSQSVLELSLMYNMSTQTILTHLAQIDKEEKL